MGTPEAPTEPASPSSSTSDVASPRTGSASSSPLHSVGPISLQPCQPQKSPKKKPSRFFRRFCAVTRALPIISPAACKMPMGGGGRVHFGTRVTGTLYGHRKARINLAIQDSPGCLPTVVMELAVQTGKIFHDFQMGFVRIALECEKHAPATEILEEPIWSMYNNGKKMGYGIKREATEEDLRLMQALRAASMGVGVVPTDPPEGDLVYMRASFERVVGSKDSETYYMVNPDETTGPEVSIFFVRV